MLIDRAYAPVVTLGPGTRIAVWTVGCSKRCAGCANPELWRADPRKEMDNVQLAEALIGMAQQSGIRRITFTGGDPFEQPESLACVLAAIRPHFDDILVYTGYTLRELRAYADRTLRLPEGRCDTAREGGNRSTRTAVRRALDLIDALIDGPYIESLNDGACPLRGSSNQNVHVFSESLRKDYDVALTQPRRIQNVHFGDTFMSIGIHGRPRTKA